MPPGHEFSCQRHFLFRPRFANRWNDAAGNAGRQAPRPPAAGSSERRCAPGRVEGSGAVQTSDRPFVPHKWGANRRTAAPCGEAGACLGSDRTSCAAGPPPKGVRLALHDASRGARSAAQRTMPGSSVLPDNRRAACRPARSRPGCRYDSFRSSARPAAGAWIRRVCDGRIAVLGFFPARAPIIGRVLRHAARTRAAAFEKAQE